MTSKLAKKAARRPNDWAVRMRSWLWFAKLQTMHRQTEDWMDEEFLPETDGRRRTFNQVKLKGSDPEHRSLKLYKYSLVDKIDNDPRFKGSKIWFASALHKLLIPPGLSAQECSAALSSLAVRVGLFRPTVRQARVGRALLPMNESFKPLSLIDLKRNAANLRKRSDIDGVTMLALLYRDAVANYNLETGIILRKELLKAVYGMCAAVNLPSHQTRLLKILIVKRLIRNDWSPIAVTPEYRQQYTGVIEEIRRALGSRFNKVDSNSMRDEVNMLVHQEEDSSRDDRNLNWATMTPVTQFLLDHFDSFEAEVEHKRRLEMRHGFRKHQRMTPKPWRKTPLDFVPPRPKRIERLLGTLRAKRHGR